MGFLFPAEVRYACIQCGKSCTHWRVWVDPTEAVARSLRWEADGPHLRLLQDERGRCLELTDDNLCRVHRDLGETSKPRVCREFPFVLAETPDGIQVGLSFRCTAVFQGVGVDWSEHVAGLEQMLARGIARIGFEPASIGAYRLDWETYKVWEEHWLRRLPDDLIGAVADTLGAALGLHPQSLERMVYLLSASAVGFLESEDNYGASEVAAAVRADKEYKSTRRGWTAPLRNPFEGDLTEPGLRYLRHVIERKTVWLGTSFLGRLLMLLTAQRMLLYYTRLEGFALAVDRLEGEWLLHRRNLEDLEKTFEETLLQLI